MDPLTASVTIVLGKYALDKGAELAQEFGPTALEKAKELFVTALGKLRQDPAGEVIAAEFEKTPQVYQKPVEQKLDEAIKADPDFAARLKATLSEYEAAAEAYTAGTTSRAVQTGSGGLAQDHSVAAGEGGIAIGGDVEGGVHLNKPAKGKPE